MKTAYPIFAVLIITMAFGCKSTDKPEPAKGDVEFEPVKKKKEVKAHIDPETCAGCKTCFMNCPEHAISVVKKGIFSTTYCRVDSANCVGCGTCTEFCITGAVDLD